MLENMTKKSIDCKTVGCVLNDQKRERTSVNWRIFREDAVIRIECQRQLQYITPRQSCSIHSEQCVRSRKSPTWGMYVHPFLFLYFYFFYDRQKVFDSALAQTLSAMFFWYRIMMGCWLSYHDGFIIFFRNDRTYCQNEWINTYIKLCLHRASPLQLDKK